MSLCRNLLGIIGLSAMVLGLQGCSTVRLAYNQAPLVVDWYLNDYVDFNAAQKPALKSALEGVFNRAILSPDLSFRNDARQIKLHNCQTFAELHNSTTPAQRQKAQARLQSYEQDVRALLRQQ